MLRKLVKGEKVMVLYAANPDKYKPGDIVAVINSNADGGGHLRLKTDDGWICCLKRKELLAIGDKVVRGPDWDGGGYQDNPAGINGSIGTVVGFNNAGAAHGHNVDVDWPERRDTICHHRMTADHQDLKPTGDSEEVGEDKLEGYEKFDLTVEVTIDDKQEDTMTREQRAVERDKSITSKEDAMSNAIIAHKEDIAEREESIAGLKAEAVNLRAYTTDKAENVALVMAAKKCTAKQAEAILTLKDRGIEL